MSNVTPKSNKNDYAEDLDQPFIEPFLSSQDLKKIVQIVGISRVF